MGNSQETPAEWGWVQGEDSCKVHWTTLPTVAKSCQQFTKCGCKTPCNANRQCKCYKVKLPAPLCALAIAESCLQCLVQSLIFILPQILKL